MRRSLLKLLGAAPMLGPSGDGLARPANAPPAVPPSYGTQPGTSQAVVIANRVIVFGPSGTVTGVFVYATGTTPGPGNPPIAVMTNAITDPYGNAIPNGVSSIQGAAYSQLINGLLNLNDASGTVWTIRSGVPDPYLRINQGSNPSLFVSQGGFAYPAHPGSSGTPESWQTITPFLNGWAAAAGVQAPQYRLGAEAQVFLRGSLDASAATAATFFTMPASYRPATATQFAGQGANLGVPAGQAPFMQVATSGSIAILGLTLPTAGAHVTLGGFYPID